METNHRTVGICQRLFNFLVDVFFASGLKRITLGRNIDHGTTQAEQKAHHSPDNEGKTKVNIEFFQAMKEGSEIHEEDLDVNSTTWTFQLGKTNDIVSSKNEERKTHASTITGGVIMAAAQEDSEAINSRDKSVGRGLIKKMITIEDGAQEREIDMQKKKEKNKAIMEEEVLEPEEVPEKKVRMGAPSHAVPIIWSAFNIDQRSDELIRRTKEALRSSSGVEAGSS